MCLVNCLNQNLPTHFTDEPIFKNLTAVKDYANQFSHNLIVLLRFAKLHDNAGHLNVVM